ncbi:MAG: glycine--tRNA ligase [Oligoflexales bacterium]
MLDKMKMITALCKKRGFVFQSSEIYGGLSGAWDYGPLGSELKANIKKLWWEHMTYRQDIVGIDSAILMNPEVWNTSGHVKNFSDPMVDCKICKHRFRADTIDLNAPCPNCQSENSFTEPRDFNLLFETSLGSVKDHQSKVYLRPETAQGIFVNFINVQKSTRKKIPFGIAQIGKSFRNEITLENFIFRTREFEQMEMQYFVEPGSQSAHIAQWKEVRINWLKSLGFNQDNLRFVDHDKLAHYADEAVDIEYNFPKFGWSELEGIHSRTDFDIKGHMDASGKNLQYVDPINGKKFCPYVVETAIGCDRLFLALLCEALVTDSEDDDLDRALLKLDPKIAPIKAAILPLQNKPAITELAIKTFDDLRKRFKTDYDTSGSIGKRYRRQDEIGTPYCVTFDFDTIEDKKVTVRNRDTAQQSRVELSHLQKYLEDRI